MKAEKIILKALAKGLEKFDLYLFDKYKKVSSQTNIVIFFDDLKEAWETIYKDFKRNRENIKYKEVEHLLDDPFINSNVLSKIRTAFDECDSRIFIDNKELQPKEKNTLLLFDLVINKIKSLEFVTNDYQYKNWSNKLHKEIDIINLIEKSMIEISHFDAIEFKYLNDNFQEFKYLQKNFKEFIPKDLNHVFTMQIAIKLHDWFYPLDSFIETFEKKSTDLYTPQEQKPKPKNKKSYGLYHWVMIEMGRESLPQKQESGKYNAIAMKEIFEKKYPDADPNTIYKAFANTDITIKELLIQDFGKHYKKDLYIISKNDSEVIRHLNKYPN